MMTVPQFNGLAGKPAVGLSLLSAVLHYYFFASFSISSIKDLYFFIFFYRLFFTSKKYLQKPIPGKLLIEPFLLNYARASTYNIVLFDFGFTSYALFFFISIGFSFYIRVI
jgi:hypothetical protein